MTYGSILKEAVSWSAVKSIGLPAGIGALGGTGLGALGGLVTGSDSIGGDAIKGGLLGLGAGTMYGVGQRMNASRNASRTAKAEEALNSRLAGMDRATKSGLAGVDQAARKAGDVINDNYQHLTEYLDRVNVAQLNGMYHGRTQIPGGFSSKFIQDTMGRAL